MLYGFKRTVEATTIEDFSIEADSLDEAKQKAADGEGELVHSEFDGKTSWIIDDSWEEV